MNIENNFQNRTNIIQLKIWKVSSFELCLKKQKCKISNKIISIYLFLVLRPFFSVIVQIFKGAFKGKSMIKGCNANNFLFTVWLPYYGKLIHWILWIHSIRNIRHPSLACLNPSAVEAARVNNETGIELVTHISKELGFWCVNAENDVTCVDYHVRFCCPKYATGSDCSEDEYDWTSWQNVDTAAGIFFF